MGSSLAGFFSQCFAKPPSLAPCVWGIHGNRARFMARLSPQLMISSESRVSRPPRGAGSRTHTAPDHAKPTPMTSEGTCTETSQCERNDSSSFAPFKHIEPNQQHPLPSAPLRLLFCVGVVVIRVLPPLRLSATFVIPLNSSSFRALVSIFATICSATLVNASATFDPDLAEVSMYCRPCFLASSRPSSSPTWRWYGLCVCRPSLNVLLSMPIYHVLYLVC